MEGFVTIQDAANIATLVAPGYFALRIYAIIYAKGEKEFSRLLVESITASLPLVAFAHWVWQITFHVSPESTSASYAALLFLIAVASGYAAAFLRVRWPLHQLAQRVGMGLPDQDFIRSQFTQLEKNASVTITLKNGEVFSGTPSGGRIYANDEPREYFFNNIAWYDKQTGTWVNRSGGIIINLDEVEYIETP